MKSLKQIHALILLLALFSQLPIGAWGNKSGYQQIQDIKYPPLTQHFISQIPTLTELDIELLKAVELGDKTSVKKYLYNNTFGSNVLIAANNIAQRKKDNVIIELVSDALNKKFKKLQPAVTRS